MYLNSIKRVVSVMETRRYLLIGAYVSLILLLTHENGFNLGRIGAEGCPTVTWF